MYLKIRAIYPKAIKQWKIHNINMNKENSRDLPTKSKVWTAKLWELLKNSARR